MFYKLSLILLALLMIVQSVHSLDCYFCDNSEVSCYNPSTTPCSGSCGKEIFRGTTLKGCYQIEGQDTYHDNGCFNGPNGEYFCTCNTHLCNSSARTMMFSFGSLLGLSALVYLGRF
ncbi:hypothetical protein M3Y97_01107100 [Aphelenchoides bicaudatus]|nr:hypothetical protein M3Y97_01107100 [Aphelenchoides bicaudatus]